MILLIVIFLVYLASTIVMNSMYVRRGSMFAKLQKFSGRLLCKVVTIIVVINAVWVGLRTIGLLK